MTRKPRLLTEDGTPLWLELRPRCPMQCTTHALMCPKILQREGIEGQAARAADPRRTGLMADRRGRCT